MVKIWIKYSNKSFPHLKDLIGNSIIFPFVSLPHLSKMLFKYNISFIFLDINLDPSNLSPQIQYCLSLRNVFVLFYLVVIVCKYIYRKTIRLFKLYLKITIWPTCLTAAFFLCFYYMLNTPVLSITCSCYFLWFL